MKKALARLIEEASSRIPDDCITVEPTMLAEYGQDWTRIYAPQPLALARPRDRVQVATLLQLCSKYNIPVVPSGGRTGLSGGAVAHAAEMVLSLDRMNRIDPVRPASLTVRVEAGAITSAVHSHCEEHGLTWPVDFASAGSSTIGGNIATNAGGIHVVRYGSTRQWVLGIEAVTMAGELLDLRGGLEKDNSGYDLCQLLIGSEGTLAVVTAATLKLAVVPRSRSVAVLAVANLDKALDVLASARRVPGAYLHAFEFFTQRCLDVVLSRRGRTSPLSSAGDAYLLVEMTSPILDGARLPLESWVAEELDADRILDGVLSQSDRQAQELWQLREEISESVSEGHSVHKNDVAVPVDRVPEFARSIETALARSYPDFEVFIYGHVGDGNLHLNIRKPAAMAEAEFRDRCHAVDQETYALVAQYSGSVSAEHGIGLLKKHALPLSRSPAELALFRGIKAAFDPKGLLNPGKIFDP